MPVKIYIAGAIRGDRRFMDDYRFLIDHIDGREDCQALAEMALVGRAEKLKADGEIFCRDRAWLEQADALVAEISGPSHGVGYEIAFALHVVEIPVLCLRHASLPRSSAMLAGHDSPLLSIEIYQSRDELAEKADRFIVSVCEKSRHASNGHRRK